LKFNLKNAVVLNHGVQLPCSALQDRVD